MAAQAAFPFSGGYCAAAFGEASPDSQSLSEADGILGYFAQKRGGELFAGLSFGGNDRAAICYMRLYGTDGAQAYLADVESAARSLMRSESFVRPTELQRAAVALSAGGSCPQDIVNAAAYDNPDLDRQGLNAWIWALIAANCSALEAQDGALNTRQDLAQEIMSRQLADGGFAFSGSAADADMTAAAIYALAPLSADGEVTSALERAEARLRALQQPSGAFCSMGAENCESTAQAIIALAALGYDESDGAVSAAVNALAEYARSGGYSHLPDGEVNALASSQALEAFTALALAGRGERLYDAPPALQAAESAESHESVQSPQTSQVAPTEQTATIPQNVTDEAPESTATAQEAPITGFTIKLILCVSCAAAGAALLIAALVKKNRTAAVFGAVFAAAAGLVWLLDIKTADEYYAQSAPEGDITVTVLAECSAALDNMGSIDERVNTAAVIPADGVVLAYCEVPLPEGATAFDALALAARQQKVRVDGSGTVYGVYVSAIGHIAEFGFGDMSGWLYSVNGEYPEASCGEYRLHDGDAVEFHYTCGYGAGMEVPND